MHTTIRVQFVGLNTFIHHLESLYPVKPAPWPLPSPLPQISSPKPLPSTSCPVYFLTSLTQIPGSHHSPVHPLVLTIPVMEPYSVSSVTDKIPA